MPTIPPHLVGIEERLPPLAAHRYVTTRLHPRRGAPGVGDSSIGGPLLWPAGEEWPMCEDGHEDWRGETGFYGHEEQRTLESVWRERTLGLPADERVPLDAFAAPIPFLPIAQLYRADVPGWIGPDDADLMQVLWCPAGLWTGGKFTYWIECCSADFGHPVRAALR